MAFKGKPPGSGSGEISRRTEALRPAILLSPREAKEARRMRRSGLLPETIADALNKPLDEVQKALVQMRMPRPETTRGTLNVTLAAHQLVMRERQGDEPVWQTFDRLIDELLRLRAEVASLTAGAAPRSAPARRGSRGRLEAPMLPGFNA